MYNKISSCICLLLSTVALTACANSISTFKPAVNGLSCIPPEITLAFPVGEPAINESVTPVPLPRSLFHVDLPDDYFGSTLIYYDNSLWTVGYGQGDNYREKAVLRYDLASQKWKEYLTVSGIKLNTPIDLRLMKVNNYFMQPDPTLWAISYSAEYSDEPSVLIRYNNEKDEFEYVVDKDHRLQKEIRYLTGYSFDFQGHLWFTTKDGLHEFIPTNLQLATRIYATDGSAFSAPVADKDGTIWFLDYQVTRLMKYSPQTDQLSSYSGHFKDGFANENFGEVVTYLDHRGWLWLSDLGWFDTSAQDSYNQPLWYRVVRSPVFVYLDRPENKYAWGRPNKIYETSNGFMWFGAPVALVSLNTNNGEWCKVLAGGDLVEDVDHNLWVIYGSQIYKLGK